MREAHRRRRHGGHGLGDTAPNFVEPANNPDQSPWVTNYADPAPTGTITFGPMTIKPAAPKKTKALTTTTARPATGKVALKRKGTAGSILDKILPLMVDAAGKQTIFGLNPALVYVAGGILSASVLALLLRFLRGGVGRVSNPKSIAARHAQR